jgi:hypothetical protein
MACWLAGTGRGKPPARKKWYFGIHRKPQEAARGLCMALWRTWPGELAVGCWLRGLTPCRQISDRKCRAQQPLATESASRSLRAYMSSLRLAPRFDETALTARQHRTT